MKPSEIFSMEDTFKKVVDPFTSEEPAVSSNIKVYGAGEENPKVCTTACEG